MNYFFLASFLGFMLRWLSKLGILHYVQTSKSDQDMKSYKGFHVAIFIYVFGSMFFYGGLVLLFASLVKDYLL